MYNHILVPVSFDENRNAEESVEIARRLLGDGGRITMLHVMEQVPAYAASYLPEGYRAEAREALVKGLSDMVAEGENVVFVVIEGHSGRTILDWAKEHKPDCIVIASHRPGMQDLFLGSTASQVVRHANCSVHVIR